MKKILSGLLAITMCCTMLAGCKSTDDNSAELPTLPPVTESETEPETEVPEVTTTEPTTTKEEETTTEEESETEEETSTEEETTPEEETTTEETTTTEATTTPVATTTAPPATTTAPPATTTEATTITTVSVPADVTTDDEPCVPVIVEIQNRYAYTQLNAEEQQLYTKIVDAARHLRTRVLTDVDKYTWHKVFTMVLNQEPQLFYLRGVSSPGKLSYLTMDRAEIADKWAQMESVANSLVNTANTKSTTVEKLKVFHDYIVLNNGFAEDGGYNVSAYGGLCTGGLQCGGYAKTMQLLSDKAGIYSMVVIGIGDRGDSHAWNVVYCNGAYYNLDSTWDDPILNPPVATNLRYRYFLSPDSWIHNITHFSINELTLSDGTVIKMFNPPACTSTAANYYTIYGKLYNTQAEAEKALYNEMVYAANNGLRVAEIRVSSKEVYDAMMANLATYANWIKGAQTTHKVTQVKNSKENTFWVIEIDLMY